MSKRSKRIKKAIKRECNKKFVRDFNVGCSKCALFKGAIRYEDVLCNSDNFGSKTNEIKKRLNIK